MRKIWAVMVLALALVMGGCGNAAEETLAENASVAENQAAEDENGGNSGVEEDTAVEKETGEKSESSASGDKETSDNVDQAAGNVSDHMEKADENASDSENGNATEEAEQEEKPKPRLTDFEITSFEVAEIMYASGSVNVRKGPSTEFDRVGGLSRGKEVSVTGQADTGWYEITYGEEKAFVSNSYLQKEKPEEIQAEAPLQNEQDIQQSGQNTPQSGQDTQQSGQPPQPAEQTAQPPQAVTEVKNVAGVIMVGDSRFVQMRENIGENSCTWIAESGKGYTWLNENAIARIDNCVGKGSKILINLGVNDPGHVNDYVTLVNAKAAEWIGKGAKVYYASVNPVWENPYTTEEQVEYFNSQMQSGLISDIQWIDSHSYLKSIGYKLVDGLHYNAETYQNLYAYFMSCM